MAQGAGPRLTETEAIEVDLVLDAIHRRWGHDFRRYARPVIERQLRRFQAREGCETLSAMIPRLLHEREWFARLADEFAPAPARMFRPREVYAALRNLVAPYLRTLPAVRVWIPGCATGEAAFAVAIILKEERVLERSKIFATDVSRVRLAEARAGRYPLGLFPGLLGDYREAGGRDTLSPHCHVEADGIHMDRSLRERITFAPHDPAIDQGFTTVQLILCHGPLGPFAGPFRDRVLDLFTESLEPGGFLFVGKADSAGLDANGRCLATVDRAARLFRRISPGTIDPSRCVSGEAAAGRAHGPAGGLAVSA